MINNNYLKFPYSVLRNYVIITLALAILGPVKYNFDYTYLILMCIYILFFLVITKFSMQSVYGYSTRIFVKEKNDRLLLKLFKISLCVMLGIKVLLLLSSIQIYGLPEMSDFFSTMANVYSDMHHSEYVENFYRKIDTFSTFLFYFTIFVGAFWFKRLNRANKIGVVLVIILDLIYQIFYIGTQRSVITIGVLGLVLMGKYAIKKNLEVDKKRMIKIVIVLLFFVVFFINTLSARKSLWNSTYYLSESRLFDLNHPLLWIFPNERTKYDVCNLISYLTQGYYGLTLSLQVPFEWTFLLGGFRGINSIFSQIFSFIPDFVGTTYPVRAGVKFGFDGLASWYTIFPWLAGDFTFFGALIYMGLVARLYMRCWIQTIRYDNPIAFIMLVLLTIQYLFTMANNQLFIQRGESLATVILFAVYLLYNKKFNYSLDEEV